MKVPTRVLTAPVLILFVSVAIAAGIGLKITADQSHENCRAILTLSRNLFHELPTSPSTPPQARAYVRELAPLYYHQYMQMDREFHLEERCGADLPPGTPPPPTRPPAP